ncbi:MAG TPA: DUF6797 domain-containing protein [Verrucomicrobiae bacterium]|nr:DUF6797 domain-containing protein [Verrucomicrobiae bacterium]
MVPIRFWLVCFTASIGSAALAADSDSGSVPAPPRRAAMDYSSMLTYTVGLRDAPGKSNANLALKGVCIRLGPSNAAAVCFDTDLLRYYAGWTGGFLDLSKTHLTSYKGSWHAEIQGDVKFSTALGPGWATDDFNDPRPITAGPLPREWGQFKGVYRQGDLVTLHYLVRGVEVLDHPSAVVSDGVSFFSRTISVGPTSQPLALRVCDVEGGDGAPLVNREGSVQWLSAGGPHETCVAVRTARPPKMSGDELRLATGKSGRVEVTVPKSSEPTEFEVIVWQGNAGAAARLHQILPPLVSPREHCHGGPSNWPEWLTTKGRFGTGPGPYVVDTVTLPENNPWHSWLRLTAFDFFSDGRAAVSTWNGDVWLVSGLDDTLDRVTWKRFAAGLFEPLGLRIVKDEVFVLCRDQLMRLRDLNGDGEADYHECFNNDTWVSPSYHAFAFDLQTDRAGNFYYTRCGQRVDPALPLNGGLVRVSKDGSRAELLATGLRAANGLAVGPNDEIVCSDNQGNWTPSSRINWVKPGGFYGYVPHARRATPPTDFDPPLCWLPMKADNSSGSLEWVTSDRWGPLKGQLLHTSYGRAALFLVLHEEVDGVRQGGAVQFPLRFDSGIQRARFNPRDGQLWVCGLKGWQTSGARDGCLQRVRYTGKPVHMPVALNVVTNGIRMTFSSRLDPTSATDEQNFAVEQWNYAWTEKYGSPDFSAADPQRQGRDPVAIRSVKLSPDRRAVTLELADVRPVMQMRIQFRLRAEDGTAIEQEVYNTINRVPAR